MRRRQVPLVNVVEGMARLGLADAECVHFGIQPEELAEWLDAFPDMRKALDAGRAAAQVSARELLAEHAKAGTPAGVRAAIALSKLDSAGPAASKSAPEPARPASFPERLSAPEAEMLSRLFHRYRGLPEPEPRPTPEMAALLDAAERRLNPLLEQPPGAPPGSYVNMWGVTVTPPWELLSRKPRPSFRVFGRFALPDVFIGTHVKLRKGMGGMWSPQFDHEILVCEDHYRAAGLTSCFTDAPHFRYTSYITENATATIRVQK